MEDLVRKDAHQRGWRVVRKENELGVVGIPCFVEPGESGRCEIWVGVAAASDTLCVAHEWQGGAPHVAQIRNLKNGRVYGRNGEQIGNIVRSGGPDECSISIKSREGDGKNAWQALKTYTQAVYGAFRASGDNGGITPRRPYKIELADERSEQEIEWIDLVRGEKVGVIGLGGVGAWIADLVSKADVERVTAWDPDIVEARNVIRMPGGNAAEYLGKPKAKWFEETYSRMRKGVKGHHQAVRTTNIQEVARQLTFAFIAVDDEHARKDISEGLNGMRIPFIDVGLSISREDVRLAVAMRATVGREDTREWKRAIPRTGSEGQQVYGRVELADTSALAAAFSIQIWRQMRGQIVHEGIPECIVYRGTKPSLTVRFPG